MQQTSAKTATPELRLLEEEHPRADPEASPFQVIASDDWRGTHCRASRPIRAGELVLCEAPLVTNRDACDAFPDDLSSTCEWQLTHALLKLGRRDDWARTFAGSVAGGASIPDSDTDLTERWLCDEHGVSADTVRAVYCAVANNAFALETPLIGMNYGSSFYSTAARFNHSCAPNCLSLRCGGNMLLVACVDIEQGDELTHSYISHTLLCLCKRDRVAHLHFGPHCRCSRCALEPEEPPDGYAALTWPVGHAETADGAVFARFMLHCASGGGEVRLAYRTKVTCPVQSLCRAVAQKRALERASAAMCFLLISSLHDELLPFLQDCYPRSISQGVGLLWGSGAGECRR